MGQLKGKRALVTGAGSGIGLAITKEFVAEGAAVAGSDRYSDCRSLVEEVGAIFRPCDVAKPDDISEWVKDSAGALGGVDVVVANAGYELVADALELSLDDWDRHQEVMLRGVFATFKAALPFMIEGGGGSLIGIGSNLSFVGLERFTSYLAAKAGVVGLMRGLAIDFANSGVRANALCPGPTMTPLIERQLVDVDNAEELLELWGSATALNRLGKPEEIAAGAVFLASDSSSYVTGSALMVDGGYTAK